MPDAFTNLDDPRFVRFVLPLARLHFERDFRMNVIKLGLGIAAAVAIILIYGRDNLDAMAFCLILPVFLLLATMRHNNRPTVRLRHGDYPKALIQSERLQINKAILSNPPHTDHVTPHIERLRRNSHILLLIRLLIVVALVAIMVCVFWFF